MRFHEHHDTIVRGGYPAIHDKLKGIIEPMDIVGKVVMDAGACTGSFGLWAMARGARVAVISDARADYIERAKDYTDIHSRLYGFDSENVVFDNAKVTADWTYPIESVDTLIARRFIYELRDKTTRQNFIRQLKAHGLTVVYLQGLVRVKNHAEPLWNVELEAQDFIDFGYRVTTYNGNDLVRLELNNPNNLVGVIS